MHRPLSGATRAAAPASRCLPRARASRASKAAATGGAATPSPTSPPAKTPIRAVLFDCDGVLVSSEHLSRLVARDVLRELHSIDAPLEDFVEFGGRGEDLFLRGPAERRGVPPQAFDADLAKQRFLDLYVDRYASGPRAAELAYPGAAALVLGLKQAGARTGVASSAARRKLDANLAALLMGAEEEASSTAPSSIDAYFDAVVAFEPPVERTKPHPDLFLRAMELASSRQPAMQPPLRPEECVVVEDAKSGVLAAKAAGMWCVGVATTHTEAELVAFGADAAARDVSALSVEALLLGVVGEAAAAAGGAGGRRS
jgi:beta-phosphoglucomutase-like phosphatase (HAD superfamily)